MAICHIVGIALISFYGPQVFKIAKAFPNVLVKLLVPTNNSIWEYSKMLVVPLCILFAVEYFIVGKRLRNFIPAHVIISACLPVAMIIINVIYQMLFGTLSTEGASAVFFLTLVLTAFLASFLMLTTEKDLAKYMVPFLIAYILLCTLYVIFTFIPPRMELFYDSVNQVFGPLY